MTHVNLILFSLSFVLLCTNAQVSVEKYFKICNRDAQDVNDCLVKAVQEALEVVDDGIKELGVPSVDPFHQKELRVDYKNNQILVNFNMKNIYVYGMKSSTVKDVRLRADEDLFHMEIDMVTPKVFVKAHYMADGSYNALQVKAHGTLNTTMTDLVYTWKLDGKPEKIGDETFVRIESFYMRPDVSGIKSHIINENPATKELTDLGNEFGNRNWRTLYRELLPFAQSNWNKIGVRIANKIFLKVPYNQIFPVTRER